MSVYTQHITDDKYIFRDHQTHKREMKFTLIDLDGTEKTRSADYFYSFGNFYGISFRYKGKRINALPESYYSGENLRVVRLSKWAKPEDFQPSQIKYLALYHPEKFADPWVIRGKWGGEYFSASSSDDPTIPNMGVWGFNRIPEDEFYLPLDGEEIKTWPDLPVTLRKFLVNFFRKE